MKRVIFVTGLDLFDRNFLDYTWHAGYLETKRENFTFLYIFLQIKLPTEISWILLRDKLEPFL